MDETPNIAESSWLVAVDRQALDAWKTRLASLLVGLEPEVGEHVRVARLRRPVAAATLTASAFARFAMPVMLRFDARGAVPVLALEALAARADGGRVVALRRHARLHLRRYERWNRKPGARQLVIALSDDEGFAGLVDDPAATLFPPGDGGARRLEDPSRAGDKLRESFALLAALGIAPRFDGAWIDLGAFPGGMTRALLERGTRVIAVDRNPPNQFLATHPHVTYWQGDAAAFVQDGDAPAQGLVCDINGAPGPALAAAAGLAGRLPPGALVLHTIKLPSWSAAPALEANATALFAAAGVDLLAARHLPANRQELAWLGRRREISHAFGQNLPGLSDHI